MFGANGKQMEGLPVDRRGVVGGPGAQLLELDDVGATLLHVAGLEPRRYGYDGRILEFLV